MISVTFKGYEPESIKSQANQNRLKRPEMTDYMNITALSTALLIAFLTAMPGKADAAVLPPMEDQDSDVYTVVDQMPEIVGGMEEIYKNIRYPREAINREIEGRVYLQFIVSEQGDIEEPEVLRDIGGGCGDAAIAALKRVKFEPGIHNGSAVKVLYTLPVAFRLE